MEVNSDPVLAEVNVFISQALGPTLHLLQYPLRPAHQPLEAGSVQEVRVRSESSQVHMQLAIPCHGENYSRSKGEGYARDVAMAPHTTAPSYQSGLMDTYSLTSTPQPHLSHRYVAGVLKGGELHLCPLQAIVQLRPTLQHLDRAAAGQRRSSAAAEASTDGDTTESEGEEAKPVTVKFARRDTGTSRSKRVSWSEHTSCKMTEEGWVDVEFSSMKSQQACDERRLLFSSEHCPIHSTSLLPGGYLDKLCPVQDRPVERVSSEPPGGAVSLSKLKALPVSRQVHDLLISTGILTLSQLSSLLQCGRGQLPAYLDALGQHGVLVQGCWVVASHLLYPDQASLCSARDYLLYCFSQVRCLGRKDVAVLTKVSHERVREILAPLTSGPGLEFKLPTDTDFIHKYPHIVKQQEEKWKKRLEQLRAVLCLPKELHKSPGGGEERGRAASKRVRGEATVKMEPTEETDTKPV